MGLRVENSGIFLDHFSMESSEKAIETIITAIRRVTHESQPFWPLNQQEATETWIEAIKLISENSGLDEKCKSREQILLQLKFMKFKSKLFEVGAHKIFEHFTWGLGEDEDEREIFFPPLVLYVARGLD